MSERILISNGEILDKFSILKIKNTKIIDVNKLKNICQEINTLILIVDKLLINHEIKQLYDSLFDINLNLWTIEDCLRIKEKNKEFDSEFIQLARNVYINNDKRAEIKKQINILTKSYLVEEKSYELY